MQTFEILLNKSYTSITNSETTSALTFVDEYYMYTNTNGGGIVNFSNVRGFLNDAKNQQIINDFFTYLTGRTTKDQTINIVSSDQKLADVFNDYYQRLITSARTTPQSFAFSSLGGVGINRGDTSQDFSISIVSDNSTNKGTESAPTFGNTESSNISISTSSLSEDSTAISADLSTAISATVSNFSPTSQDFSSSDIVTINQVPTNSMTVAIIESLSGGFRTVEDIFYHDWESQIIQFGKPNPDLIPAIAVNQGMTKIPLSISGGTLKKRSKSVWVDTTKEEGYYIIINLERGTNQISRNNHEPPLTRISKKALYSYPQYSGITDFPAPTQGSTRLHTIINTFVDLNLELDETSFYTTPIRILANPIPIDGGNTAPTETG